ncbi:hypothetical protein ACJ72_00085 [Emergomyces africanus]|uniref:Potassium channel tetramerisation-type BTB domain-containing protein n=1 Tax=Emergomyces africanus TaxID=1955775 RepID=A0A1B7P9K5_9EURO|nr:hypothetical protein ACJ72_00085 [Emergomyces africanus]
MSASLTKGPLKNACHLSQSRQPDEDTSPNLNSSLDSTPYQLAPAIDRRSPAESCHPAPEASVDISPVTHAAGPPSQYIAHRALTLDREDEPLDLSSRSDSNFLGISSFAGASEDTPDWNASYTSFLNFDNVYEHPGESVNEQRELVRSPDGPAQATRKLEAVSPTNLHPVVVGAATSPFQEQLPASHTPSISGLVPTITTYPSRVAKRKLDSQHSLRTGKTARPNLASHNPEQNAHKYTNTLSSDRDRRPIIDRMAAAADSQPQSGGESAAGMDHNKSGQSSRATPNANPKPSVSPPGVSKQSDSSGTGKTFILPPQKVFPIQIGSELFRLSGSSISSDAPSYFSHFFEEQLRHNDEDGAAVRTLYIDRDPANFRDIVRHLQGYYVRPRDGPHLVKLFADAQFYSLPRLISQLFESEIFIQIGDRHFQIPRDIFSSPGDSPNFFTLAFAIFFTTPKEVFERPNLLRPPALTPPVVANRSADVFAELLNMLKGYPIHIRNEEHRAELLRDCRYFHLRGLEQKLIPHAISYNLLREKSEILIRLEDIRQSGIQFVSDVSPSDVAASGGWVHYSRPFVDETSYELIVEIGDENTLIDLNSMRAVFFGLAKARVSSLFHVIANKMNLPTVAPLGLLMKSGGFSKQPPNPGHISLSEDHVKILIDSDADIILDGAQYIHDSSGFKSTVCATPTHVDANSVPNTSGSNNSGTRNQHLRSAPITEQNQPSSLDTNADMATQPSAVANENATQSLSVLGSLSGHSSPPPLPFCKPAIRRAQYSQGTAKRKRLDNIDDHGEWVVQKGQWKICLQANEQDSENGRGMEIVFVAVKLYALSGQRARNGSRGFLS